MHAEARPAAPVFFGHAPLKVGSYELHEVVSANRWGVIFAAQDQNSGARRALGVLDPALVTIPGLRASFLQSANQARGRQAACLVRVFEAGIACELPYIVSEWMEGHDAHQLLRRMRSGDPLSFRHGLSLAVDALRATAMLHATGAQHGRIALDKLFIRADGQFKLIGIGLPTVGHELWPLPDDPDHYALLAPEQITDGPVGPATDVYALSLVTAMLCTGSNPLQRSTIPQITSAILAGETRLRGDLQRTSKLTHLLGDGTARDSADRPDATELADELDALLEDEGGPVSADEWSLLLAEHFRAEGPVDRFREQALRDRSARVIQALQSGPPPAAATPWEPIVVDGMLAEAPPLLEEDLNDPPTEETIIPALSMEDDPADPLLDPAPVHAEQGVPPLGERGPTAGPAAVVERPPALAVEAPAATRGGTQASPSQAAAVRGSPSGWAVPGIALLMISVGVLGIAVLVNQTFIAGDRPRTASADAEHVGSADVAPRTPAPPVAAPLVATAAATKTAPSVATAPAVATKTAPPVEIATVSETKTAPAVATSAATATKTAPPVATSAATATKNAPPVATAPATATKTAPPVATVVTNTTPPPTANTSVLAVATTPVVATPPKPSADLRYPAGPVLKSVAVDRGGPSVIVTALLTNGSAQAFHYLDEGGANGATRYVVRLKGVNAEPQRIALGEPGVRALTVSEDGVGAVLVVDCDCSSARPVRVSQTETTFQVSIPKAP